MGHFQLTLYPATMISSRKTSSRDTLSVRPSVTPVERTNKEKESIAKGLALVVDTEKQFVTYLNKFCSSFLSLKSHSLEDMYMHQIEVPDARKIVGFSSRGSLMHIIFSNLISQSENTIMLVSKAIALLEDPNPTTRFSLKEFCVHLQNNIVPLFKASFLCWEWVLQAIDGWKATENNFRARIPDYEEKFRNDENMDIDKICYLLLKSFPKHILRQNFVDKRTQLFQDFFRDSSMIESLFSLPLIRTLNYTLLMELFVAATSCDHEDYLTLTKSQNSLAGVFDPIIAKINDYQSNLVPLAAELPVELQSQFLKKYRRLIHDGEVTFQPKNKKRRVVICNDILIIINKRGEKIKFDDCKVKPIPVELHCEIDGKYCNFISSFGWNLWKWECEVPKVWRNSILQAKRYVSMRTDILFNRSGASIDSLLPLEFVKLCEELQSSRPLTSDSDPYSVAKMMESVRATFERQNDLKPLSPLISPRLQENHKMKWIFGDNGSKCEIENFKELINDENGKQSIIRFAKRNYCYELVSFYCDVEKYISEPKEQNARFIVDSYIIPDSPMELNIDTNAKNDILLKVTKKQFPADLFQEGRDSVLMLIMDDTFPRYLNSEEFKDFVTSEKTENQLLEENRKRKNGINRLFSAFVRQKEEKPIEEEPQLISRLHRHRRSTSLEFQFQGTSFVPKY